MKFVQVTSLLLILFSFLQSNFGNENATANLPGKMAAKSFVSKQTTRRALGLIDKNVASQELEETKKVSRAYF